MINLTLGSSTHLPTSLSSSLIHFIIIISFFRSQVVRYSAADSKFTKSPSVGNIITSTAPNATHGNAIGMMATGGGGGGGGPGGGMSQVTISPALARMSFKNVDSLFGVRPSDIDKYSRVVFPVCFVCFHLMYWIVYMHISEFLAEDAKET